jgi:hypothetical protein
MRRKVSRWREYASHERVVCIYSNLTCGIHTSLQPIYRFLQKFIQHAHLSSGKTWVVLICDQGTARRSSNPLYPVQQTSFHGILAYLHSGTKLGPCPFSR